MNNFCTNCGKRLENGEYICKNCNTPVVDIYSPNMLNKSRMQTYLIALFLFIGVIAFVIHWGIDMIDEAKNYNPISSQNSSNYKPEKENYDVTYHEMNLPLTTYYLDVSHDNRIYFESQNAVLTFHLALNMDNITATVTADHPEKLTDIQEITLDYYDMNHNRVANCNGKYEINNSSQMWACTILMEQVHSISDSNAIKSYQISIQ